MPEDTRRYDDNFVFINSSYEPPLNFLEDEFESFATPDVCIVNQIVFFGVLPKSVYKVRLTATALRRQSQLDTEKLPNKLNWIGIK